MAKNSAVKWNDDQLEAINARDKDILVSAGAGSGKTAVMTERVVSLISEGAVSADELLVVTFTKAAASEMKKKIRDALYGKIKDDPELASQAAAFENAQISTLHSFAANVVKRFYQTAGVDPAFGIADETRGAILLSDAADEALEELFSKADEDFTSFAMAFDTRASEENLKEAVTYLYSRLAEGIDGIEKAASCVEELRNGGISENTRERLTEYLEGELSAAIECFTFARDYAVENSAGEKVIAKLSEYISDTDSLKVHLTDKGLESFWPRLGGFSLSRFTEKKQIEQSCYDVIQSSRSTGKEIIDKIKRYTDLTLEEYAGFASKTYKPLCGLVKALRLLDEKYTQAKDRMGLLDFNDLEKLCLKVLGDEDSLSEIKNECRYEFVDEYQDTNDIQEAIINRVASPERLFTVGDIKQSIYAFRGAKPQLFMKRYDEYSADKSGTKSLIRLTRNYRSTSQIIDAVNAVFSLVMTRTLGGIDYGREKEALEVREDPILGEKPRLDIIILPKYDKNDPESVKYGASEINAAEASYTAGIVRELISSGYIYRKDDSGALRKDKIVPGDIAILLRTVRGVAPDFTAALREAGIPAVSPEDKPFYDLTEIILAISLLKVIDNFTDDIALAGVMRSFIYNFSPDDLVALKAFDRALSLHEVVMEYAYLGPEGALKEKAKYLIAQITGFREDCEKKSLARLIATVYARTNLPGYVSALPGGNVRRENLIRLKDLAEEYEQSALGGLYGFIRYADRARENQSAFRSMDASGEGVQVISIHRSKGLQYPVVIIPRLESGYRYGDRGKNTFSDITVNEGRIAARCLDFETHIKAPTLEHMLSQEDSRRSANSEELRLLYVASTRAEQKLFFVGAVTEDKYEMYSRAVFRARSERADNALELVLGAAGQTTAISVVKVSPGERNTYAGMPESKESAALGIEEKE
ncbi:MAG: UvrD-helicase domain-containing protein, partial [Oscillospiraceae bacterium]|nr:UvrD-helicase domain-containing protein [Oscillospiraceae bacterium]